MKIDYAVLRRAGKLIRESLDTNRLELAKRLRWDFLNELQNAAPDIHTIRLGDYITDFPARRTGALKTPRK